MNEPRTEQTGSIERVEDAHKQSQETNQPLLRVSTFGAFQLAWQVPISPRQETWNSRTSARTLFKLLLCAPGRQATKSVLAGILWPETDEEKARESLRSAYKVLRKVLRTAQGEELVELRNNGDILVLANQARLWVDADAFEELAAQANRASSPDAALALWEEAQALLRGEFLADDQGAEWTGHPTVKRRRQALWLARCRVIRHLSDLYVQRGHVSLAEETLEQHLVRFPTDQDALHRLLLLLEQQGSFEQASILYERARRTLEAVGKQPATHVRVLYERFQQTISSSTYALPPQTERPSPSTRLPVAVQAPLALSQTKPSDVARDRANPITSLSGTDGQPDITLAALRALIQPEEEEIPNMLQLSRRQLLELGIAALISRIAQISSKRISPVERAAVSRALGESIKDGWKNLFSMENAQVVATAKVQLALIHQAHALVYPSTLPYLYTGTYGLMGIGLHCQERDEEALQAYHHGYIASLATGDSWYIAQSLICQADSYHALGHYNLAIQTIEEALRIIGTSEDEEDRMIRARAHLLTCWADNAMMLHDNRTTQEKLEVAKTYLDPASSDEEFDLAAWLVIAGKYALHSRNYTAAKDCFEEALVRLPEQWLLRRAMTATGLAMAYARMGERHASLDIAKDLLPVITIVNAPLTNRWFADYLQQDLLGTFPDDKEIRDFIGSIPQQLPQGQSGSPSVRGKS